MTLHPAESLLADLPVPLGGPNLQRSPDFPSKTFKAQSCRFLLHCHHYFIHMNIQLPFEEAELMHTGQKTKKKLTHPKLCELELVQIRHALQFTRPHYFFFFLSFFPSQRGTMRSCSSEVGLCVFTGIATKSPHWHPGNAAHR